MLLDVSGFTKTFNLTGYAVATGLSYLVLCAEKSNDGQILLAGEIIQHDTNKSAVNDALNEDFSNFTKRNRTCSEKWNVLSFVALKGSDVRL